jgi:hypothetical protein
MEATAMKPNNRRRFVARFEMIRLLLTALRCSTRSPPLLKIHHLRLSPRPDDTPHHILISIIDLLVLSISWDQSVVTRSQVLSFLPALAHNSTMAAESEYDSIYLQVSAIVAGGAMRADNLVRRDDAQRSQYAAWRSFDWHISRL